MPTLPEKAQQIVQAHAGLIHRVVIACQNRAVVTDLEDILKQASDNGWTDLVAAIRKILAGKREVGAFRNLDDEDFTIIESILMGLQNPATLPDLSQEFDANMAAPGLAAMIHAARGGSLEALQLVANMVTQMLQAGVDMARLAGIVRPLVTGERDADKLCEGMGDAGQKLVLGILRELAKLEGH
ncbi:MAG: hypothetical protein HZB57_00635 [Gammaproteobacteria bacterium]|nr:hypothetical protein [Gammaproteobacteria bacterium]